MARAWLALLMLGSQSAGIAAVTPALQNYEFLPVPAMVKLGGRITLTMAGCVEPTATVPTCPPPKVLANSVSAAAGSLRQVSPTEFEYMAPATMPSPPMVAISADYQLPFQHQVLGMVMLIDPKSTAGPPSRNPPKPGQPAGNKKWVSYGYVSVLAAPPGHNGSWQRNIFWLQGADDTSSTNEGASDDHVLWVNFKRMTASMTALRVDNQGRVNFSQGQEEFEGEFEVFSHLTVNLTRQLYGWQAHGDKLGDRPATSKAYMDPGYNSSCGNPRFSTGRQATLHYTDLAVLAGTLNCGDPSQDYGKDDYGEGVILNWTFFFAIN